MSSGVNVYLDWLAIPLASQPPNHYVLLGIPLLEDDIDVIEAAALQRVGLLRRKLAGPQAEEARKLLQQIEQARNCLLDPEQKQAYDLRLRHRPKAAPAAHPEIQVQAQSPGTRRKRPPAIVRALGGVGVVALLAGLGWLMWRRPQAADTPRPVETQVTQQEPAAPAAPAEDQPVSVRWQTTDLLARVDPQRDAIAGNWQRDGRTLRYTGTTPGARLEFREHLPEAYSFSLTAEAIPSDAAPRPMLGLMLQLGGRPVQLYFGDSDPGRPLTYLVQDHTNAPVPSTIVIGKVVPFSRKFGIRCLVQKDSLDVFLDGKRLYRWSGDPATLSPPGNLQLRSSRYTGLNCLGDFVFHNVQFAPLELPARTEIDVLALVDLERDGRQGRLERDGKAVVSRETETFDHGFELPIEPPLEYTLQIDGVREPGPHRMNMQLHAGLVMSGSAPQLLVDIADHEGGGLEAIDGQNAMAGPTQIAGARLSDGKPFSLTVTVLTDRIVTLLDGRPLVDWKGEPQRFSRREWGQKISPQNLYLGCGHASYRWTRVVLKNPVLPDKSPPLPGTEDLDLLARIDPQRDAFWGTFQKVGGALQIPSDLERPRLIVPVDLPEEYVLSAKIFKPTDATDALEMSFPVGSERAMLTLNGMSATHSGVLCDGAGYPNNNTTRKGTLFKADAESDLEITVHKSGMLVLCDGEMILNFRGNPRRLGVPNGMGAPTQRRLVVGAWKSGYQIRSLKLSVPKIISRSWTLPRVPKEGKLLPIIDPLRDSIDGEWSLSLGRLISPFQPGDIYSWLRVPAPLPQDYILRTRVARLAGAGGLVWQVPIGERRVDVVLDGWDSRVSALEVADGLLIADRPDRHKGAVLLVSSDPEAPQFHDVEIIVRQIGGGRYRLRTVVQKQTIIDWQGYPSQLRPLRSDIALADEQRDLYLNSHARFAIAGIQVEPIDPQTKLEDTFRPPPGVLASATSAQPQPMPPATAPAPSATPLSAVQVAEKISDTRLQTALGILERERQNDIAKVYKTLKSRLTDIKTRLNSKKPLSPKLEAEFDKLLEACGEQRLPPLRMQSTLSFQGHDYAYIHGDFTWNSAKERCEAFGGHLVTFNVAAETDFVLNKILRSSQREAWLGGTDAASEGNWQWVTGERWDFGFGADNADGAQHAVIWSSGQMRFDDVCGDGRLALCCEWESNASADLIALCSEPTLHEAVWLAYVQLQRDQRASRESLFREINKAAQRLTRAGNNAAAKQLPAQFGLLPPPELRLSYRKSEYAIFRDARTWHEARAQCERYGGHLVYFDTTGEAEFIQQEALKNRMSFWIGNTDEEREGHWLWGNGEPSRIRMQLYRGGGDHVGYLEVKDGRATFRDANGSFRSSYLCEWEVE